MAELTPEALRHLAAIVRAEREVFDATQQAFAAWLPVVLDVVLEDSPIVAAIDPDRAGRTQDAWEKAIEGTIVVLAALWARRYRRKGKNKARMATELKKFEARTRQLLAKVSERTFVRVNEIVTEGKRLGLSDDQIRDLLRPELSPNRDTYANDSARIARTSVMSAYNGGAEAGYKELAALTGQEFTKTWRSLLDGRTRETHLEANGQTVRLDEKFTVGGYPCDHPGDDELPVWEAANCRCIAEFRLGGILASVGAPLSYRMERSAGRSTYAEWVVIREDTQEIVGEHATKAMAFVQTRALAVAADDTERPAEVNDAAVTQADPVVAAATELPTGWRGPIAALDRLTGDDRWLATPPEGLRTREYPMTVTRKHVSGEDDIFIGTIENAWIQDGMLYAEGAWDLDGTDGAEAARLVGDHMLFTMSIDPDQVIAEQRLVDDAGNMAPDAVLETALNTGAVPEGYRPVMVFVDWRLSSVALVSIPAYDEARIEPVYGYVRPERAQPDEAPVHTEHAMIALRPTSHDAHDMAIEGGLTPDDLHITLRYLGEVAGISQDLLPSLHGAASNAAKTLRENVSVRVAGSGQLGDEGAVVLFLNGQAIHDAHAEIEAALEGADLHPPHRPFLAHMTISYDSAHLDYAQSLVGREFLVSGVSFDYGTDRTDYRAPIEVVTKAESIVASAALGGQIFHAEFFEAKATGPTALTVDENGHVYGHVRLYGTCYQYGGGQGDGGYCVEPPLSACDYAKFHVHGAKLDDGRIIAVGALTYGEGHESRGGLYASQEHYNNVATMAAKLVASEDEWGVWVTGEVCDDHRDRAYDLLLSPMSGHWEPDADNGGHLEMLAAHIVCTPGYAVRRIVASFDDAGNATHLVVPSPWSQKGTHLPSANGTVVPSMSAKDFRRAEHLAKRTGVDRDSRAARIRERLGL